jgi:hypothetical protein
MNKYMWLAVAYIDMLVSFISFNPTLNPNNFGFVKKFHAKKMLNVNLFKFLD